MSTQGQLGAATTRWSDYVGTAAADDAAAVAGNPSVYELAGLDRDRWLVVAVDIEVSNGELGVVIYAADRSAGAGDPDSFDVDKVITEHGHLPVKAIRLTPSADTQPFLDQIFRRVAIRLVARSFRDDVIVVQDDPDA